jgi:anti-anti-sigma factor
VDLAITIEHAPQRCMIVRICGELDIASAPDLREQLLVILDRQTPSRLVLELSRLEFIDSSGTAVLVSTQRRAGLLGCEVSLVAPQAQVSRVLQLCGLDRHFLIFATIGAAAGGTQPDILRSLRLATEHGESDHAAT